MEPEGNECVRVVVRSRPFSKRELADNRRSVLTVNVAEGSLALTNPDSDALTAGNKGFTFDAVYDENSTQRTVYDETAFPLVESVLSGYNGTIFAYGQTGCGKTHTMQGLAEPPELRGIIPNSFDHIFDHIQVASSGAQKTEFLVRCSYLEIYNEEIRDLLAPPTGGQDATRLELHENPDQGVYVKDLSMITVDSVATIDRVMMEGNRHRTTGATLMNETSSRSHSIFTIVIEMSTLREGDGKEHIVRGKLNLVDLAGSERASKTGATGARMKEGIKINLSLTALGNVISSLVENASGGKQRHIPYRDSKLTRLLQDSLGGNTKTVMVAAVGPADYNYEETLSTLRYANRAKNIKNKPKVNEDPKDALLRQYQEEISRLKSLLVTHLSAAGLAPEVLQGILAAVGGGGEGGGRGGEGGSRLAGRVPRRNGGAARGAKRGAAAGERLGGSGCRGSSAAAPR